MVGRQGDSEVEGESLRPTLMGGGVVLRGPKDSDKADRLAIGRHREFVRLVGGDVRDLMPLTEQEVEEWYRELSATEIDWVIEVDERAAGIARLRIVDEANRRARYSIGIFDPALWGRGIGTAATQLMLAYAFDALRLHRVELRVLTENTRAIAMYEKCGFVREGTAREVELVGGRWLSDVWMSVLEQEYRRGALAPRSRGETSC